MSTRQTAIRPSPGLFAGAVAILRENHRTYFAVNAVYYGTMLLGMFIALVSPSIRELMWHALKEGVSKGPLAPVAEAYQSGNIPLAIVLTFLINLFVGSLLSISIPSAIIPFSGLFLAAFRALIWGLEFMPLHHPLGVGVWLHLITLLLEGQAYVLATVGACIHGMAFLSPSSVGAESNGEGYVKGAGIAAKLYVLVAATLLISAVYESILGIWILPHLLPT